MKKKITILLLAGLICITGTLNQNTVVHAQTPVDVDIEFSELLTEDAIIGYADYSRGVYYASGMSIINDSGGGKIGWGGATHAARTCKVSVNAIVERLVDGSWTRVTSASNTVASGLVATVSKTTLVGSGYYYRVRCQHFAATDYSSSWTDALRM